VLALVAAPSVARAAGERERGLQLAREGRCEAALTDLAVVRADDPRDAEASLVAGQCWIRLGRYPEAAAALEVARAVQPDLPDVDVSLAIARFHLEEPDAARAALARAEARDPDRASVQLYRGLLLLQAADNEAAARALERARALDREYAEPVSSYYAGLALEQTGERESARAALTRVLEEWPGTVWADEARAALARLDAPDWGWWLQASLGAEYDSNVVLRGSGVELPDDISDDADWRGVWTASAGVTYALAPTWSVGLSGSYYGTEQDEVDAFDVQYPSGAAWVDHAWSDVLSSRLRYEFAYAWVDADPYLLSHRFAGSLYRQWSDWGTSELWLGYDRDDYRFDTFDVPDGDGGPTCPGVPPPVACGPAGLDESTARNRDGQAVMAGLRHSLPLPSRGVFASPVARASYGYTWYDARGREYRFQQHAFSLGGGATLPWELQLGADVTYAYRPYERASTFTDPDVTGPYSLDDDDKHEHQWTVAASLAREITENLSLAFSWRYDDNDSNTSVFEYDRHVVGLRLTGSLGR